LTAWNPRKDDLILLAFPALYSLTLVFGRLRWDRYVVTLVPFMAILAGRSIVSIVSWLPLAAPRSSARRRIGSSSRPAWCR